MKKPLINPSLQPMQTHASSSHTGNSPYPRFFVTLAISFVVMYALMFFNVADTGHIMLSLMRAYMALLMTASMALIMLPMMEKMYPNKRKNALILTGAALVFSLSFTAIRTQAFVTDVAYMKAMIPHHSSAIHTSTHANLSDPETQRLAADIIAAQEREIAQMEKAIQRLERR